MKDRRIPVINQKTPIAQREVEIVNEGLFDEGGNLKTTQATYTEDLGGETGGRVTDPLTHELLSQILEQQKITNYHLEKIRE